MSDLKFNGAMITPQFKIYGHTYVFGFLGSFLGSTGPALWVVHAGYPDKWQVSQYNFAVIRRIMGLPAPSMTVEEQTEDKDAGVVYDTMFKDGGLSFVDPGTWGRATDPFTLRRSSRVVRDGDARHYVMGLDSDGGFQVLVWMGDEPTPCLSESRNQAHSMFLGGNLSELSKAESRLFAMLFLSLSGADYAARASTVETHEPDSDLFDVVNRPSHYTSGDIECITVLEQLNADGVDFRALWAMKYLWRAHRKNGLEDLKKAQWFLNRLVDAMETKVVEE